MLRIGGGLAEISRPALLSSRLSLSRPVGLAI
jgi:hypothetical protein